MRIDLIHGPNLNLLGTREPEIYGTTTLPELERRLVELAKSHGAELTAFQSNHEGALVDRVQQVAREGYDAVIINAGAFTHTSVALHDAFAATRVPFIEVHISNVHARESFRHQSYLSALASGVIVGCGIDGYRLAVLGLVDAQRWHP